MVFLGLQQELSKDKGFCGNDCNSIHSTMQGLLFKENKVLLAPVLEKHIAKAVTDGAVNSMQWQILSGTSHITDSGLLSKAAKILKVCFKFCIFVFFKVKQSKITPPTSQGN